VTGIAPYGTWVSPITAADVASDNKRVSWPGWVAGELWWTESHPGQQGRVTLMRCRQPGGDGAIEEVLPPPWYVRSRVIEYGGHPWAGRGTVPAAPAGPVLVFANWADQRLYRLQPDRPGAQPRPISPQPLIAAGMRFADFFVHPDRDEVWAVRETFTGPAPTDLSRDIVAVPLDGSAATDPGRVRVLAASHHFLACPRLSPDGQRLSWIGWDHPAMPWDQTVLCVAEVSDGATGPARVVAGGEGQSIVQAEWTGPRTLVYAGDASGWWNLYRLALDRSPEARLAEALCPRDEEFGGDMWQLGQRWFAPLADGSIAAVHGGDTGRLSILDTTGILGTTGKLNEVASAYTCWDSVLVAHGGTVAAIAAGTQRGPEVVTVDAASREPRVVRAASACPVEPAYLPEPASRTFRGQDGRDIFANVYPPRHPGFAGPAGEAPPYLVFVHGGPTGHAPLAYDLEIAFFTSRGFGVVEVNYGGSTGHGRAYRERLVHNWGVVDTADCAEVGLALAAEGSADAGRLVIRGGSAGGWTSACSVAMDDSVYRGGIIYFPILDLAGWRTGETHDFESQYLESLVGPWPQAREVYDARSPVNHADRIGVPFLLLQGLEDVICPPLQCERLLERIAGRGIPHAYLAFEGEQHGFRQAETIIASLQAELSFLGQVLGFDPPGVTRLPLVT
jgi:dipeptidyl aminopeptidase/acylaminoacyl peptidase